MAEIPHSRQRRVYTGCLTCRIRKVKCDEAKPTCARCNSSRRQCDGYSALPFSRADLRAAGARRSQTTASFGLVSALLTDTTFENTVERRYFHFFRTYTVPSTTLTIESRFWDTAVLQASHAERAIRRVVLALSALHSSMLERSNETIAKQHVQFVQQQYPIALQEAQRLVEAASLAQVHHVLVMCLLFVVWESMQGNHAACQRHVNSCRAILSRFWQRAQKNNSLREKLSEISQVLARMDISTISFSDGLAASTSRSSIHFPSKGLLETGSDYGSEQFRSLKEASSSLMDIVRELLIISNEILPGHPFENLARIYSLDSSLEHYSQCLASWGKRWSLWKQANKDVQNSLPAIHVELWYATAKTTTIAGVTGPESRYDILKDHFTSIVQYAEFLSSALSNKANPSSFSMDLGYITPTIFVTTRCRDPQLRRRALKVLRSTPRFEGSWQSIVSANVCDQWIAIEEDELGNVTSAGQIPEERRVSVMDLGVEADSRQARLRFQLSSHCGPGEIQERVIPWTNATS